MPDTLPLTQHLAASRRAAGLTQAEAAEIVSVDESQLRRYETGRCKRVPDDTLIKLALTYGDRTILDNHPVAAAIRRWPEAQPEAPPLARAA